MVVCLPPPSFSLPPHLHTYTRYLTKWVPNVIAYHSMYKNETTPNTPAPISINFDSLLNVVQSPQLTKEQAEDSWEALRPRRREQEQCKDRGGSVAEAQLLGDDDGDDDGDDYYDGDPERIVSRNASGDPIIYTLTDTERWVLRQILQIRSTKLDFFDARAEKLTEWKRIAKVAVVRSWGVTLRSRSARGDAARGWRSG